MTMLNSIVDTGFWRRGCVLGAPLVNAGPLLPCGDARCGHGVTGHDERDRCEWVACGCDGYQWAATEAER